MKKKLLSLLIVPVLLTGCQHKDPLVFSLFSSYIEEQDLMRDISDNDNYYSHKETTGITTRMGEVNSLSDLLEHHKGNKPRETMLSKGERKLLVVPIYFTDSDISNQADKTIFIQNAFFGETNKTNYDSVVGYYNKSSYGQLKISGEVAPWFNLGISSNEAASLSNTYMNCSNVIVERAVDYLKENSGINFDDYDLDLDDNIDGIYAIYDFPYNKNNDTDTLFWAYTHYTFQGENGLNKTAPYANNYSWSSIDMITQSNNKSYTNYIIHETGHLLGLTDYYNTRYSSSNKDFHYQPTGCFDMMDYNIGDHSSFSKYLYKWTSPMVVKSGANFTYDLKPFSTSGEYFLVPSESYKDSPFGEYLLIEFFVPTGLNDYSGTYSYTDKNGNIGVYRYPNQYGLRIYHVNATLGYFKKSFNSSLICTVDNPDAETLIGSDAVYLDYAYSNSIDDKRANENYPVLYHLLESSGNNTFKDSVPANNDTLFKVGSDFGISKFTDFTFSDGSSPKFTLKVKALSTKYITLEMTKE